MANRILLAVDNPKKQPEGCNVRGKNCKTQWSSCDDPDTSWSGQAGLKCMRNPNLKLGKVKDTGNAFEAEILTKNNSLVDKVLVDKSTKKSLKSSSVLCTGNQVRKGLTEKFGYQ